MTAEVYELMEKTSNILRGMTLDPAIPKHAKDAMRGTILELEEMLQKYIGDLGL